METMPLPCQCGSTVEFEISDPCDDYPNSLFYPWEVTCECPVCGTHPPNNLPRYTTKELAKLEGIHHWNSFIVSIKPSEITTSAYNKVMHNNAELSAYVRALEHGMHRVAAASTTAEACRIACSVTKNSPRWSLALHDAALIEQMLEECETYYSEDHGWAVRRNDVVAFAGRVHNMSLSYGVTKEDS